MTNLQTSCFHQWLPTGSSMWCMMTMMTILRNTKSKQHLLQRLSKLLDLSHTVDGWNPVNSPVEVGTLSHFFRVSYIVWSAGFQPSTVGTNILHIYSKNSRLEVVESELGECSFKFWQKELPMCWETSVFGGNAYDKALRGGDPQSFPIVFCWWRFPTNFPADSKLQGSRCCPLLLDPLWPTVPK